MPGSGRSLQVDPTREACRVAAMTHAHETTTYAIGDRVVRFVDDELGTVTAVNDQGEITAVEMDTAKNRDVTYERFTKVIVPEVGMPCSILLYTDTSPAVVIRVNKKSITVARVPAKESTRRHADHCECGNPETGCPKGNPWPLIIADGDLDGPRGEPERFRMVREGRYRNGSIGLRLGKAVDYRDYRE